MIAFFCIFLIFTALKILKKQILSQILPAITFIPTILFAQYDSVYVSKLITELSSERFLGRGVYKSGELKASEYIQSELFKLGIKNIQFQDFTVQSNYYQSVKLSNDKPLKAGTDFLPHPYTGSGKLNNITITDINYGLGNQNNFNDKAIYFRKTIPKDQVSNTKESALLNRIIRIIKKGAKALFIEVDEFEFSYSHYQFPIPVFQVRNFPLGKKYTFEIINRLPYFSKSRNIIASAASHSNDSLIVIMAHYDHLGAINDQLFFPGANDNASGTALLMNLAKTIQKRPLKYKVVFIFFAAEEIGLLGSKYFINNPLVDLSKIKLAINFDMVASAENGRMVLGGVEHPDLYKTIKAINDSLKLGPLGKRKNKAISDHYYFIEKNIKTIYIYTKDGKQPYHSINDIAKTLDWPELEKTYLLIEHFLYRYF